MKQLLHLCYQAVSIFLLQPSHRPLSDQLIVRGYSLVGRVALGGKFVISNGP